MDLIPTLEDGFFEWDPLLKYKFARRGTNSFMEEVTLLRQEAERGKLVELLQKYIHSPQ